MHSYILVIYFTMQRETNRLPLNLTDKKQDLGKFKYYKKLDFFIHLHIFTTPIYFFKTTTVLFHDDENRTLGMFYLNQFVICEDDQFECRGVFKVDSESNSEELKHITANDFEEKESYRNLSCNSTSRDFEDDRIQEPESRIFHLILASSKLSLSTLAFDYLASDSLVSGYLNHLAGSVGMRSSLIAIPKCKRQKLESQDKIGFLTCLKHERMKCISKDECRQMYKIYRKGGEVDSRTGWTVNQSLGDDLVIFYERMKSELELPQSEKHAFCKTGVALYHLKMLSENDDEKFAFSLCYRKTFTLIDEHIFNMIEFDKFDKRNYRLEWRDGYFMKQSSIEDNAEKLRRRSCP